MKDVLRLSQLYTQLKMKFEVFWNIQNKYYLQNNLYSNKHTYSNKIHIIFKEELEDIYIYIIHSGYILSAIRWVLRSNKNINDYQKSMSRSISQCTPRYGLLYRHYSHRKSHQKITSSRRKSKENLIVHSPKYD
jgi:hypothetical protein